MSYCQECGHLLIKKELEAEGVVPFCDQCQVFRFPRFNVAVSAIVLDEESQRVLLIQQYGRPDNVLVAGYVSMGEELEAAVAREIKEETNLTVVDLSFNASRYYAKNEVLMVNFICHVKAASDLQCNQEIDQANWFDCSIASQVIKPNSLAKEFLDLYLSQRTDSIKN